MISSEGDEHMREAIRLLVLFGVLFSYRQFQGGFVSNFLLIVFLIAAAFALWSQLILAFGVRILRRLPQGRLQAGDALAVEIEVQSRLPFGLFWLTVEDRLDGGVATRAAHVFLGRRTWTFAYRIPSLARGVHRVGPLALEAGDVFGLFRRRWTVEETAEVRVRPRPLAPAVFAKLLDEHGRRLIVQGGKRYEAEIEVGELRPYRAGDRLSRIHWKASARASRLMVVETPASQPAKALIVLYTDRREDREAREVFELKVSLAAAWAERLSAQGLAVGLWTWSDERHYYIPPTREAAARRRIIDVLTEIVPSRRRAVPPPGAATPSAGVRTIVIDRLPHVDAWREIERARRESKIRGGDGVDAHARSTAL